MREEEPKSSVQITRNALIWSVGAAPASHRQVTGVPLATKGTRVSNSHGVRVLVLPRS